MSHKSTVEAAAESHLHDDDLIVTPKGTSKLRFILILALTIFVLLIFTVGSQVQSGVGSLFGGGGLDETHMTWVHPDTGETFEVDSITFQKRMQTLDRLASARSYVPLRWREDPGRARVEPEDAAMFFILDRMSGDAGIQVSDTEFKQQLRMSFGTTENLLLSARRLGLPVAKLEADIREVMRGQKLKDLLMLGVTVADADTVQTLWDEAHPEFTFEYAVANAEDFEEEARGDLPDDEVLLAWYEELPLPQQRAHFTEDRVKPLAALVSLDADFDPTALVTKYPAAEGLNIDDQARSYYNKTMHIRFPVKKDEAPGEDETEGSDDEQETEGDAEASDGDAETSDGDAETSDDDAETSDDDAETADGDAETAEGGAETAEGDAETTDDVQEESDRLYLDFEEVTDVCKREAPIEAALTAFLLDVKERPDADFVAEATALGLTVVQPEEALSRSEMGETEGLGGTSTAGQLMFFPEGQWLPRVIVEEDAMVIARVIEKKPGEAPPLADMREDLLEEWVTDRSKQLSVEKLEAVRDSFGERPADATETFLPTVDADAFKAAVTAAGFEVVERPYMERLEIPNDDFEAASPGDLHIRGNALYHDLEVGQVPEALPNAQGGAAFLVRLSGERPAPISEIKPAELTRLREGAITAARDRFEERCFFPDSDYVKERYQLELRENEPDEETTEETEETEES